jgi:hypothetical protein
MVGSTTYPDGTTVYYSTVTGATYGSHAEAAAADGAAGGSNAQAGSTPGSTSGDVSDTNAATLAQTDPSNPNYKGPGYTPVTEPNGTVALRNTDPAATTIYQQGQQTAGQTSAATAPAIAPPPAAAAYGGGQGTPAAVPAGTPPTAPIAARVPLQAFQPPVQRQVVAPRPVTYGAAMPALPAPAAPTSVTSAAPPAFASVDYSRYDTALQDLDNARSTINNELDRLSGGDPFGNEAFLQQATNRAQATAMGTAASARGGPAALAGANRTAQGVQTQLQAQGAEQLGQQRAQDAVQSAQVRSGLTSQIADLAKNRLDTETQLTQTQTQAVSQNLNAWLTRYANDTGLAEADRTNLLKLGQDNADNLRQMAVEYSKIDQEKYNTDMTYRASIDKDLTEKYASDNALKAAIDGIKQQQKLTTKDVLMGLLDAGAGVGGALIKASDSRLKTDIRDPDLHDLAKFLETKAYRYKYKNEKHGAGEFFGPMAQDLLRSKAGSAAVVHTPEGLKVDTGRLALADHAALSVLAEQVKKLSAKRSKRR